MERIRTRDGSFTFFNEEYEESYHCKFVGALEESRINYYGTSADAKSCTSNISQG
jgi:hypothetical protein